MNYLLSHLTVFVLGILLGFFVLAKNARSVVEPPVSKTIHIDTCLNNINRVAQIIDTVILQPEIIEKIVIDTFLLRDSSIYPIDSLSNDTVDYYWVFHETPYGDIDHKLQMGYKRILNSEILFTPKSKDIIRPLISQRTIILEPNHRLITTEKYVPYEKRFNQIYLGANYMLGGEVPMWGPSILLRTKSNIMVETAVYLGKDQNNFITMGLSFPIARFSKND